MNYRVRRQGQELGVFTLEDLRRRRATGELSAADYVQREGTTDWQPLDLVLEQGYRATPPPLPTSAARKGPGPSLIWPAIGLGVVLCVVAVVAFGLFVRRVQQRYASVFNPASSRVGLNEPQPAAVAAAGRPIVWTTHTLTATDARRADRVWVTREWLDDYKARGERNPECDAAAVRFLQGWIASYHGGADATNRLALERMADRLAANPHCTDPLVLTVTALNCIELHETARRLERALAAFPRSRHRAYPQFYATITLAAQVNDQPARVKALDQSALKLFRAAFADGSFASGDQQEIAELLVNGWGYGFFYRNAPAVCRIADDAGPGYRWLALVLKGESDIIGAWRARGGGYASTVTPAGWQAFGASLAAARRDLTEAWRLHPDYPLAPERMITVALGDSGIQQMRLWFDRTVRAQIDDARAWSEMRWGLRPRWYGNEKAMLALGVAALHTGRFDTDVPREYFDCVSDVESEMNLPPGHHLYSRPDIWTNLERMYEGYIASPAQTRSRDGWRSTFAAVAYLAGQYAVARQQLAALHWKPWPQDLSGWGRDLSLMPLEVAARTGPWGVQVAAAEVNDQRGELGLAIGQFADLSVITNAGERTRQFIACRLAALRVEQRLQQGGWVDFLPAATNDPNWEFVRGQIEQAGDGSLEVRCGPAGHFLFSRVRVGPDFEVKGEFDVVRSSNRDFQAGLIMGTPDVEGYNWDSFRMKRNQYEGDVASFARGWTTRQVSQPVTLRDGTNSFDFRFHWGRVTASVNGIGVFQEVAPPQPIATPPDNFLLGVGAFNDSNRTVLRYRHLEVRRLTSAAN